MTVTRYAVIKLEIDVGIEQTDQELKDHIDEIMGTVASELDYKVEFDGTVEAGSGAEDAIDVKVKITGTELVGMLEKDPT